MTKKNDSSDSDSKRQARLRKAEAERGEVEGEFKALLEIKEKLKDHFLELLDDKNKKSP